MIAFRSKTFAAVALALGGLLGQVDGCTCGDGIDLCTFIEEAAVIVRATALSRSDQVDINADVTYTVNTTTIYKSEPNTSYAQVLSFTTGGNDGLCGIYMEIGEEYLIDLVRVAGTVLEPATGALGAVGLCGAFRLWSSVTEDDLVILQDGDCLVLEGDECGDSTCSESQECVAYTPTADGYDQYPGGYYCVDVCDPSPCEAGETCQLVPTPCIGVVGAICSPVAECTPAIAVCDTCGEFQECLLYAEDTADEQYYCSDVCDPSPCADDEVCSLFAVLCFTSPCPSFSHCSIPEVDSCEEACDDFQTCGLYTGNDKLYCSDTCEDGACLEGEQCELRMRNWCRDGGVGCPQKRKCF